MIPLHRRHISDEAWEKHLPKPIYIIYAVAIFASILLLNVFANFAIGSVKDKSLEVLDDCTGSLEHFNNAVNNQTNSNLEDETIE